MVIRILYHNGSFDLVKSSRLDDLLPTGQVAMFKRSDGWVTVGVGPIRKSSDVPYNGPERREAHRAAA